jgi:hypothetical protein
MATRPARLTDPKKCQQGGRVFRAARTPRNTHPPQLAGSGKATSRPEVATRPRHSLPISFTL